MSKEIKNFSPETLPIITWMNQPVITTEILAALYKASEDRIHQNFKRNIDRFDEGKHCFKLVGSELSDFLRLTNSQLQISPKTRTLTLWTERGTVRHAKMLGTDKAWEVQDKLEEFYFTRAKKRHSLPTTYLQALEKLVESEKEKLRLEAENSKLNTLLDNEFGYCSILRASTYAGVHEKEFSWRPLKAMTLKLGLEVTKAPSPRYGYQNLYPIRAFEAVYPDIDFDDLKPEFIDDKSMLVLI